MTTAHDLLQERFQRMLPNLRARLRVGPWGDTPELEGALRVVEVEADAIVERTAQHLEAWVAATAPDLLRGPMLEDERLVTAWPWDPGAVELWQLLHALPVLDDDDEHGSDPMIWSAQIAPANVVQWLGNRLGKRSAEVRRVAGLVDAGRPFEVVWGGEPGRLPLGVVGWLMKAEERAAIFTPARPNSFVLDAGETTVKTVLSLQGTHPEYSKSKRSGDKTGAVLMADRRVELHWSNGERTTQMWLPTLEGNVFAEIEARYGTGAVQALYVVYVLLHAKRAAPGTMAWWYPGDFLSLVPNSDPHAATKARKHLEELAKVELRVHYDSGPPLMGSLVKLGDRSGSAVQVGVHSELYAGCRNSVGALANRFYLIPTALLEESVNGPGSAVYVLASLLGNNFLAQWKAKKSADKVEAVYLGSTLAEKLDIRGRRGRAEHLNLRTTDSRIGTQLLATLEAAERVGIIESYTLDGNPNRPAECRVTMRPGPRGQLAMMGAGLDYVAQLPDTGGELKTAIERAGVTIVEAAKLWGVDRKTVERATRHPERPLGPRLRQALRSQLWS